MNSRATSDCGGRAPGASLAAQVREPGYADFARNSRTVTLRLKVWDYVMQLLEDHQIAPNQTFIRQ